MPLLGQATIISWNRVAPEARAEFERWHTEEHLPERLGIEGFLRGRRYHALAADRDYLIVYEARDFGVLESPAYLARLNDPTPWTRRVTPTMQDAIRGLCDVCWSVGMQAPAPFVAAVRLPGEEALGRSETEARALVEGAKGITAVHACRAAAQASARPTVERMHRETEIPQQVLLIEGTDPELLLLAARDVAAGRGTIGLFRRQTVLLPSV